MASLTWLHLSDLCFGSAHLQKASDNCYFHLLEDLSNYSSSHSLSVNFIVITGDITNSSQIEEYQTAIWFLDQLLKTFKLPKNRLFIVPGDRDIDTNRINRCIVPDLSTPERVDEFLANHEAKEIYFKKFNNYKNFVNQYFGRNLEFDFADRYFWMRKLSIAGMQIGLLGLNSTWNAHGNNDDENLLLGAKQIRTAVSLVGKVDLCIAALHHPLGLLKHSVSDKEPNLVQRELEAGCQFILHGHSLQPESGKTASSLIIPAGLADKNAAYSKAYNFTQVDLSRRKIDIHFRRFSASRKEWEPDNSILPNIYNGICALELAQGESPPKLNSSVSPLRKITSQQHFNLPVYFAHSIPLEEYWVERLQELTKLDKLYHEREARIVGLIGDSGIGKTALVRRWLEALFADGIFYWNFQYEPSLDAFLFAALNYLSSNHFDPESAPSSAARLGILMTYLQQGRFVLVLDSLDEMLTEEDDNPGFKSTGDYDFTDMLNRLAWEQHQSLILLTSRRQISNLLAYEGQSYQRLMLDGLKPDEAEQLFLKYKIEGSPEALEKVAYEYNFHPLSLKLIAGFLRKYYVGQIKYAYKFPPSLSNTEGKINDSILSAYEIKLTPAKRIFMSIMACFNQPLKEDALFSVFCQPISSFDNSVLVNMCLHDFQYMLNDLVGAGLINVDSQNETSIYSLHPLLRSYYYNDLPEQVRVSIHQKIAQYYENKTYLPPQTIADLSCAIEAFQHSIGSNEYERAFGIYINKINIPTPAGSRFLSHKLGAYELDLKLISQFFPNRNIQEDALLVAQEKRSWLVSAIGFRLMMLGQLSEAVSFLQRGIQMDVGIENWANASIDSQNLCCIYLLLGELAKAGEAAQNALLWAQRVQNESQANGLLEFSAYPPFLQGKNKEAGELFEKAKELNKEGAPTRGMTSLPGIYYAEYLFRNGHEDLAEAITLENLALCRVKDWTIGLARCYRLLADFNLEQHNFDQTESYLKDGLHIARHLGLQEELANINLGFGRLLLARQKPSEAKTALNDALQICQRCGYKLIEINTHNTLAKVYTATHKPQSACNEAETALNLSCNCGYYWGQMDAQTLLEDITV